MSRTDVHRPWEVQLADPYDRRLFVQYGYFKGEPLMMPLRNLCGCRMCTEYHWRKLERRRQRYAWKRDRHLFD